MANTTESAAARAATRAAEKAERAAEKALERFEERLGFVGDSLALANEVVSDLEKDPNGEVDEELASARALADELSTAETVEKEADLDLCVSAAWGLARALVPALQARKAQAKSEGLPETAEALTEALATLKGLVREMKDSFSCAGAP